MPITFQEEPYNGVVDEAKPLLIAQWRDVALDQDTVPLNPDWATYEELSLLGHVHVTTARDGNRLVGYAVYLIAPNLHYKHLLCAEGDIFWLAPEYRQGMTGVKLLRVAEGFLRAAGVDKVVNKVKLHKDKGVVFERLGYSPIERVYAKRLAV